MNFNSPENFPVLLKLVTAQLRSNWTFAEIRHYCRLLGVQDEIIDHAERVIEKTVNEQYV